MQRMINKITFLILAFTAFVFAGCSNIMTGTTELEDTSEVIKKCVLNIGIENYDSLGKELVSRTILPNDWDPDDVANFKFYISGNSSQGESFDNTEITFTGGSAQMALSYSIWELTLTAKKNDNAVLQGHTFVDLTNGGTSISFKLVSGTLKTGGQLNLGGTYTDDDNVVNHFKIGLYKFDTGEKVGSEVTSTAQNVTDKEFSYTKSDVPPGTYLFAIKFFREKETSNYVQCGYWSDMVVIAAGNTTEKTDIVIPDIIQKKPAAPTDLKAWLKDGSETEAGYYTIHVEWADNSINEENFVLTVKEYTALDDAAPTVFKILGVKEDNATKEEIFWGSDTRINGTLLSGSTWCELKLPTGRLFDISMEAQNFAGKSDVCARVAAGDTVTKKDPGENDRTFTKYLVENDMRINRVKMSYVLDGGTLAKDASTNLTGTYVEYKTYEGSSFPVYGYTPGNPAADPVVPPTETLKTNSEGLSGYPRLIKDNHPFQKWDKTESDGSLVQAVSNDEYHDLTVTANYKLTYTINYSIDGYSDMEAGRVTITYNNGITDVDCINGIVEAGAAAANQNPPITFTVEDPTAGQMEFDSYRIRIDQSDIYTGTSNTFTYSHESVTNLSSGTHTVNVFAKKKNTDEWYSYTCAITISR